MTMSIKEKSESEEIEWSPEDEIQLFFALDGLKPVGINKYFFMACIADRLSKALNREVSTEAIWSHLKTMYNLDALDELEPLPFPNEQKEFSLPDEFSTLISKKRQDIEEATKKLETPTKAEVAKAVAKPPTGTSQSSGTSKVQSQSRESPAEKKVDVPKRAPKRTRGSASLESNSSPSTTPPPVVSKRRRI
ncbi:MRG/MORF4L-binding protein isoform X2 [Phlebotomus papatasi]|uniref:MRG/MORF4L-binding protein isoform X2 n=1 Tax=Phlebotomus papatasi TaxID=29031 RepID=UPI002484330E|nr:MRG/MORF4L-binding protein isoform X2 [Phlebotomus papatasi]